MRGGTTTDSIGGEHGFVGRVSYRSKRLGGIRQAAARSRGRAFPRLSFGRAVRRKCMILGASLTVLVSFSLLSVTGLFLASSLDPLMDWGHDELAGATDWPADYLNGTVTPIGSIHSDFGTYEGASVTVQGNVTAAPGEFDNGYIFVQDHSGGIMVNASGSGFGFTVDRGDLLRLNGTVGQTAHGMHTVEAAISYWVVSTGNPVEVAHKYNSSLVAPADQSSLVEMNGYMTGFEYQNTSHTDPDWDRTSCTSTLWMYGRTFPVHAVNITLSDYEGFVMVSGIMFCEDDVLTICPRSASDIVQGNGPFDYPFPDGDLSEWSRSETAVDDSDSDSRVSDNEIRSYSVTWDGEFLYLSLDYTVTAGNALILYIDSIPGSGASNVSAFSGDASTWSRHLEFFDGFAADLMLCRYEDDLPQLFRITSNVVATDITTDLIPACSGSADGSDSVIEAAIPWNSIYDLGPARVPEGATMRMVTVMTYSTDTNMFDCSPDSVIFPLYNDWGELYYFYDLCLDCDMDGYPDDYSSGFAIPEFSTLLVIPLTLAIVVLVSRARRRKTQD